MEMSVTEVIFSFLGGLGIFLYGLKIMGDGLQAVSYTHLRAHETSAHLVCRLLLEKN
ncbi:hypothetical protein JMUB7540_28180 [Staphylococcus aureus]